jgi:hypothetical protein
MLIYDQRNFDLHLTHLNCAIANWATIMLIICRPTQKLLAYATGGPLILIPASNYDVHSPPCVLDYQRNYTKNLLTQI